MPWQKRSSKKLWHVSEESATKKKPCNNLQFISEDCQIFKHPKHKFLHNKDLHHLFYTIEKESPPPPTPSSTHALFRFFVYYIIIRDYNIDKKIRKYSLVLSFAILRAQHFQFYLEKKHQINTFEESVADMQVCIALLKN